MNKLFYYIAFIIYNTNFWLLRGHFRFFFSPYSFFLDKSNGQGEVQLHLRTWSSVNFRNCFLRRGAPLRSCSQRNSFKRREPVWRFRLDEEDVEPKVWRWESIDSLNYLCNILDSFSGPIYRWKLFLEYSFKPTKFSNGGSQPHYMERLIL